VDEELIQQNDEVKTSLKECSVSKSQDEKETKHTDVPVTGENKA